MTAYAAIIVAFLILAFIATAVAVLAEARNQARRRRRDPLGIEPTIDHLAAVRRAREADWARRQHQQRRTGDPR